MKGMHDNCNKDCIFLEGTNEECITLHDPVPVRYALEKDFWNISAPKDLLVESLGQWAKGMPIEYRFNMTEEETSSLSPETRLGNRVRQALESLGRDEFQRIIMSLFTN